MQNFRLIEKDVDTKPLLEEIALHEKRWHEDRLFQDKFAVFKDADTFVLRWSSKTEPGKIEDTEYMASFPAIAAYISNIMETKLPGSLGVVFISRIGPNKKIHRHADGHASSDIGRYHLVLTSPLGSVLLCGDEEVCMQERELWWFDNSKPHESFNESDDMRVHLVFDVLPKRPVN